MARINLLPWREELRKEKQKEFGVLMVAFAIVAVIAVGIIHYYYSQRIDVQGIRNQYLNSQIAVLDKRITEIKKLKKDKNRLEKRIRAIERLQRNRPLIVHIFDTLVDALPQGVSLTRISQRKNSFRISGEAESNARVSSFMQNLEASKWLKKPKLDVIKTKVVGKNTKISAFTLEVKQVVPKPKQSEKS